MCIKNMWYRRLRSTGVLLVYLLILGGVSVLLLCGCALPVAPFHDEPFPKDLQAKLNAGASQDEVIQLLGAPHATRLGGKVWYYGGTRPMVGLFGPNGNAAILDYNWVEVAFDNALRLQQVEHYESKSGCARSGNCLLWGEWDPVSKNMTDKAIFTSSPEHDQEAKMFSPPLNGCAIYVFCTSRTSSIARSLLLDDVIAISVDDIKTSWLNIDTYLRVEVPRGGVEISAGRLSKKQWHCGTNDVGYFWVQKPFSGPNQIEVVNAVTGKKEIARRRLLLSP